MLDPERVKLFKSHVPLCNELGIHVGKAPDGEYAMILPYDERLVGDLTTGVVHGSVVSILLDTVCGAEAFVHPDNTQPSATLDLRIDYMRSARPGHTIYARSYVHHLARSVAFLRGVAWDEDIDRPIATAVGNFTFAKREKTDDTK